MKKDKTKPQRVVVPLWPDAGQALGLGKSATYEAARRGDIPTVPLGRLKRVPLSWLRSLAGDVPPKTGKAA